MPLAPGARLGSYEIVAATGAVPSRFTTGAPSVARTYDITPDGSRFIGTTSAEKTAATGNAAQINLVLNWFEELKQRAPVR